MSRDTLSDLLRSVRVRGAVFYYVSCRDQWSAEAPPAREIAEAVLPGCEHVMEYHMIAKGSGWAALEGRPPIRLDTGDIVIFPQGDPHVLSSAPGIEPLRRTADWVFATRNEAKPMPIAYHHGVVEAGAPLPAEEAAMVAVCGFLGCDLKPFNPLVAALPRVLHLPAGRSGEWVVRVIEQAVVESCSPRPGGDAVLERLAGVIDAPRARGGVPGGGGGRGCCRSIPPAAISMRCPRMRPAGWRGCGTGLSARRFRSCTNAPSGHGRSTNSHAKWACRARRCTIAS